MYINSSSMSFLPHVKYLEKALDNSTLLRYNSKVCLSTFLALERVAAVSPFLSLQSTSVILHATLTSRLVDYCSSILSGVSADQLACLQHVQNNAAWLLLRNANI